MQTASCEIPGWMKHKLHRITRRNVNNLRYADDTTLMAESKAELKSLLMNVKEESEKIGLKLRSWHPVSSLRGKQMEKQWKKITFTIRKAPQLLWHVNLLYTLTCSMALETKKFIPLKHIWVAWEQNRPNPTLHLRLEPNTQTKNSSNWAVRHEKSPYTCHYQERHLSQVRGQEVDRSTHHPLRAILYLFLIQTAEVQKGSLTLALLHTTLKLSQDGI